MLTEGMYIADRYEIAGKVGTGGMSDVYKAKDHILGRFVAIKVLKQEFSEDINFVTKFRSEAQSAAGLEHPNIVNIYDVGSENGMHYIVMEYVEGITLKTYIEKKRQLTYKEAVSIAIQVGRGIEAAHSKHIVHRDIKPQNIIISTEGKVKVTDFGIARAATNHTIRSDVMGSVHYTSPEQARNGFVDGKSDIYSLGIVMYEMVTGRVPFDGDTTVAVAIQHLQEEMVAPSTYAPELPVSMEKIIKKCTQKNPDRRYDSMGDLLIDLKKVLISPNEDFVVITPVNQNKTRVIAKKDVDIIKEQTANRYYEQPEEENINEIIETEEEDTGFLNPKMEKAVTIMGIIAAIIVIIVIVCIIGSASGFLRFSSITNTDNEHDIQTEQDYENENSDNENSDNENGENSDVDVNVNENENNDVDVNTDIVDNENEDPAEETVVMISLLGKTEDEAREALRELNLGLDVTGTEATDRYEEGQIISQNIAEGEKINKHETISVIICSGPDEFEAPGVVGKDEDTAKLLIEDMELFAKRDYAYHDTIPEGQVISQSPEEGTAVRKGDTITYVVSRGTQTLKVPDVTNKSFETAKQELEAVGFIVTEATEEHHDTVAEGNIIRQSPTAGEYKSKGAVIHLVKSLGKETVYYSYNKNFDKPEKNVEYEFEYKVELSKSESDELIPVEIKDNGNNITISATNIEDCKNGTLTIFWKWTVPEVLDEEGNVIEEEKEYDSITGPLNVSFKQQ